MHTEGRVHQLRVGRMWVYQMVAIKGETQWPDAYLQHDNLLILHVRLEGIELHDGTPRQFVGQLHQIAAGHGMHCLYAHQQLYTIGSPQRCKDFPGVFEVLEEQDIGARIELFGECRRSQFQQCCHHDHSGDIEGQQNAPGGKRQRRRSGKRQQQDQRDNQHTQQHQVEAQTLHQHEAQRLTLFDPLMPVEHQNQPGDSQYQQNRQDKKSQRPEVIQQIVNLLISMAGLVSINALWYVTVRWCKLQSIRVAMGAAGVLKKNRHFCRLCDSHPSDLAP
jgi:hypothetical protein